MWDYFEPIDNTSRINRYVSRIDTDTIVYTGEYYRCDNLVEDPIFIHIINVTENGNYIGTKLGFKTIKENEFIHKLCVEYGEEITEEEWEEAMEGCLIH